MNDHCYGLWFLVAINTAVILLFAASFIHPRTGRGPLWWPMLVMFPALVLVYRRLSISEERETRERFGAEWDAYAARTPRFLPRRGWGRAQPPRPREVTS